jgi:hypothetical protein
MSLDSIGPILNSAQTQLALLASMEPGILVGPTGAKATAAGADAVAVTTRRYDAADESLPDNVSPVKMLNGEGTFEVTTAEATVAAGDLFWNADDGLVSKTPTGGQLWEALEKPGQADANGLRRFEARLRTDRVQPFVHTVTAAEASANSVDLVSPWGGARVFGVPLIDGGLEAGTAVSESAGTVTIAATSLSEDDVITGLWGPTAA